MLVLLLTWYGPVPWCHCHAAAGAAERTSDGGAMFERHLQRFHATLARPVAETLGWHLHWTLPGDRLPAAGSESSLPDSPSTSGAAAESASESLRQALQAMARPPLDPLDALLPSTGSPPPTRPEIAGRPTHFYDGFAPTLSLPRRFSIARC